MNYFFELFFFHSGMIVHHTSLMTWEKKTPFGRTSLNLCMQKYTCRLTPQFSKLHLDNTLLLAINIFGIILSGHLTSLMGRICKGHLNRLISWHLGLSVVHRFSVGLKWGFGKAIEAALCLSMPKPVVETPNVSRFQPLSHWLYVKWGDLEVVLLLRYSKHFVQCNCQQAVSGLGAVWTIVGCISIV